MNDGTTRPVNSDLEDRLADLLTPMLGKMRDASGLDGEVGIFELDKPIEAENGKNQKDAQVVRRAGLCKKPRVLRKSRDLLIAASSTAKITSPV